MPKPSKVLMIVENDIAPLDTRVWWEALALRDHGYAVSVISPKGAPGRPVYEQYREPYEYREGIHIYRYDLPEGDSAAAYVREYLIALLATFRLSIRIWARHGFDVIHVANPPDIFFPLGWFYRLAGKRFVFDQHDLAPELFEEVFASRTHGVVAGLFHRLLIMSERSSYRTADLIVAANESFRRTALQRGRCSPGKVEVVRNNPDLALIHDVALEPELKMGRRFLLAYVGVMGSQDGVENAIYALDYLVHKRGRQDIALALLGDGSQFDTLRSLTRQLGLDAYIHFHGWSSREDVLRYLSAADVGLCPDPYNPLNDRSTMIKTMEYMALGMPVVAFDLSETRLSAQEAALYATRNNVEDFAGKIATLLDDDALRKQMGAFGRRRVEEELNWDRSRERLIQAYGRLPERDRASRDAPAAHPTPQHATDPTPTASSHS
jgi:glycosyltransferase involved in cell wall biosynthesis